MDSGRNKEIEKSVYKYLKRIKKQIKIEKAYLFGSYANGNPNEDSDIDIAIISSSFSGNRFKDNVDIGELVWGIDSRIEPIAFRPEDFNNDNLLAAEIMANGVELVIA